MSVSNRLLKLEQRPQPQRPHGMTHERLAAHLAPMPARDRLAFVKTMTDHDLSASIDYLQTLQEEHHANPQ